MIKDPYSMCTIVCDSCHKVMDGLYMTQAAARKAAMEKRWQEVEVQERRSGTFIEAIHYCWDCKVQK